MKLKDKYKWWKFDTDFYIKGSYSGMKVDTVKDKNWAEREIEVETDMDKVKLFVQKMLVCWKQR